GDPRGPAARLGEVDRGARAKGPAQRTWGRPPPSAAIGTRTAAEARARGTRTALGRTPPSPPRPRAVPTPRPMQEPRFEPGADTRTDGGGPRRDRDERERARYQDDEPAEARYEHDLEDHRGVPELEQEDRHERGDERRAGRPRETIGVVRLGVEVEPEGVADQEQAPRDPQQVDPPGADEVDQRRAEGHRDRAREDE